MKAPGRSPTVMHLLDMQFECFAILGALQGNTHTNAVTPEDGAFSSAAERPSDFTVQRDPLSLPNRMVIQHYERKSVCSLWTRSFRKRN